MKKSNSRGFFDLKDISLDKIALTFNDPDTNDEIIVPVSKIIVGGLDYAFINAHLYVYEKQHGYLSIKTEDSVMLQRLDPSQIKIIDWVLSEKKRLDEQQQISSEFENTATKLDK